MKASDARAMTIDQLDEELVKLKKEQFNLRFQRATGQLENTARVRLIRRDIARIKTAAQQKRVGTPAAKAESKAETKGAPVKKIATRKAAAVRSNRTKPKASAKSKARTRARTKIRHTKQGK